MDDPISRQAVMDALNKRARETFTLSPKYEYYVGALHDIGDDIKQMPTIEKRKTGRWLISEGACEPDYMECSRCKWITEYYGGLEEEWGYCPNCGADMRGGEHGND